MRRQAFLALSTLSLCAAAAGAQERRDDRVRVYTGPLAAARAVRLDDGPRAVIGVATQPSGGLRDTLGLLVSSVTSGGPAEKAGIEEGNRLQAINGVSLRVPKEDAEDWGAFGFMQRRLTRELDKAKPGDEVTLRVYAAGRTRDVRVRTADPDSLYRSRVTVAGGRRVEELRARADSVRKAAEERPTLGLSLGSTGSMRDTLGVLVMGVVEGGPAEKAGLEEGIRIQAIDGVDLRASRDDVEEGFASGSRVRRLTRAVQAKKPGDDVELRVYAGGQTRTVRVKTMRAGDLPRRGRSTFIFGDGVAPMPPMPPMPPRIRSFEFDDLGLRDLDDLHIEIDGARLGGELQRLGPEIRVTVERAMREAERGLGAGLDGLHLGLEGMARALEGLDLRLDVDVDVDRPQARRTLRSEAPPTVRTTTSF